MARHAFQAKLVPAGPAERASWTCAAVPADVAEALGAAGRTLVAGSVNGYAFRGYLFPGDRGGFFLMVNLALRQAAGVGQGDVVRVELERDDAPRTVDAGADVDAALDAVPEARAAFDAQPYSHRKEYLDWVNDCKRPETRAKRIAKLVRVVVERAKA